MVDVNVHDLHGGSFDVFTVLFVNDFVIVVSCSCRNSRITLKTIIDNAKIHVFRDV